ncbi:hypothetical protein [Lentibacillus sp. JNUCC-1]|uniref:hypothetical protein n=1 Tax=Lentibacillus sp. JNUCC-1 TaxID=2654513 RepID=UPI0012E6FD63|nr:hypothetical protein [Lentibacillus sp. JNUCC-1]
MNSEEFKSNFKKYREGTLTEEEEIQMEGELDKLEQYQAFLEAETEDEANESNRNPEVDRKILRRSQSSAYIRTGLIALVVGLLIPPSIHLFAMVFDLLPQ